MRLSSICKVNSRNSPKVRRGSSCAAIPGRCSPAPAFFDAETVPPTSKSRGEQEAGDVPGTATVMFGALLARVPDPYTLMAAFHVVYTLLLVLAFIRGVMGIWAGLTVLAGRTSGRTLALIAGFLSLYDIPLGTTLGIWTLVLFLR